MRQEKKQGGKEQEGEGREGGEGRGGEGEFNVFVSSKLAQKSYKASISYLEVYSLTTVACYHDNTPHMGDFYPS